MMVKKICATSIVSFTAGAIFGMLFAPKSGKENRAMVCEKYQELKDMAMELNPKDIKSYVTKETKKIEKKLDSLSKEKVEKMAKKQAEEIETSVEDLIDYVSDYGTPILVDSVEKLRNKAYNITDKILKKMEDNSK